MVQQKMARGSFIQSTTLFLLRVRIFNNSMVELAPPLIPNTNMKIESQIKERVEEFRTKMKDDEVEEVELFESAFNSALDDVKALITKHIDN